VSSLKYNSAECSVKLILKYVCPHKWISAARLKREKYKVKGSDGKLRFKIADSHFPDKLFDEQEPNEQESKNLEVVLEGVV